MIAHMMMRRLKRISQYLQFSTHLREDSHHRVFILDCFRHITLRYPTMLSELTTKKRV